MKKCLSIILITGVLIMLFGCNGRVLEIPKYKSEECYYGEGFRTRTDYCKYFYDEDSITEFKVHKKFKQVTDSDIENIKSYFEDYDRWIKLENYYEKYDFDYHLQIKKGDYFYIVTKEGEKVGNDFYGKFECYDVYYMDMSKNILYFIHLNT